MPSTLWLDTETFNTRDIKVGTYAYAETAELLLLAFAIDDGPVQLIDYMLHPPNSSLSSKPRLLCQKLSKALRDPETIVVAHNAQFDRRILHDAMGIGEDIVPLSRWHCTMAQALAHALPGSLDQLGQVLGLSQYQAKIKEGKALIKLFCQPATGHGNVDRNTPHTHPEQWQQFREYAIRDVETLRTIAGLLPDWNWGDQEVALWHLDQVINDRGFQVDVDLIRAGAKASEQEKQQLAERFTQLTEGAVGRPTQRQKLKNWLQSRYNLTLPDTQASTLQRVMVDNQTPAPVREILQLVQQANKTSTAKYAALHQAVSADGRFRGGLQFNGASRTRRWSGRTFQPQNLPSRGLPEQMEIERYIAALKSGVHSQES